MLHGAAQSAAGAEVVRGVGAFIDLRAPMCEDNGEGIADSE